MTITVDGTRRTDETGDYYYFYLCVPSGERQLTSGGRREATEAFRFGDGDEEVTAGV